VICWATSGGEPTFLTLRSGQVLAEYLSDLLGDQRGQATLPDLEIGNGASRVLSRSYPTCNLIHRCFINLVLRKAKFFGSLERMIATFDRIELCG
jgi:hypothetical protein